MVKISALDPVVTPLYTDVLPETQLAEVNVKSRKLTLAQLTNLINGGYLIVDDNITLPSPCPAFVIYKFTAPGKSITLPAGNGANAHPAGKPIWFIPHPDNNQNFSLLRNDSNLYLSNIGNNNFMITYGANDNQNGLPISDVLYATADEFLKLTGGTLTGNLIINGAAAGGFYGIDVIKNANAPAQFNATNQNAGANARAEFNATVNSSSSADAVYRAVIDGVSVWTWGLDNSDNFAWALSKNASLGGVNNTIRVNQDGAINFPLTPFAMAYLSATQSNVTGDNTTYNLTGAIFTELFDQGANFLNGTFTAPVTGKIEAKLNMVLQDINANHNFCEVALVTTSATYIVYQCNPAAIRTKPGIVNTVGFPISITVPMTIGDNAYWSLTINNDTKTVDIVGGLYTSMSFKLEA